MKKSKLKLSLNKETIRSLAAVELGRVNGGRIPLTGPIDVCPPASNGGGTCTSCPVGTESGCLTTCGNGTEG